MGATVGKRRNSMSKHHIQPECGEYAGWRGAGRPNPSREAKFSGTNGDRGIYIFLVQLITGKIGNLTRLVHTLLHAMAIQTHSMPLILSTCPLHTNCGCGKKIGAH